MLSVHLPLLLCPIVAVAGCICLGCVLNALRALRSCSCVGYRLCGRVGGGVGLGGDGDGLGCVVGCVSFVDVDVGGRGCTLYVDGLDFGPLCVLSALR